MTDPNASNVDNVQSQSTASTSAPVSQDTPAPVDPLVPQSKVSELIGRYKRESYEKGRTEALAELSATKAAPSSTTDSAPTPAPTNSADMARLVAEEVAKQQREQQLNQQSMDVLRSFHGKIEGAKTKYPELTKQLGDVNLGQMPEVVILANSFDNTADIMHDLLNNPHKIPNIMYLARTQPQLAQREMSKLADSIKQNEAAKNLTPPNAPLDQAKPSTIGVDSGKYRTVEDLKKAPWNRY